MLKKHYKTHNVYTLIIDEGKETQSYYTGSHNSPNKVYTPIGILAQSGNKLRDLATKTHNWNEYYNRVRLLNVEEFETEEEALSREQELLNEMFETLPKEQILNKRRNGNLPIQNYQFDHNENWRNSHSQKLQKPKSVNSLKGRKREVK